MDQPLDRSAATRLRLRSELDLQLRPDQRAGEILDGLLTRRVGLGAVGVALATKLDGTRTADEILDALVAEGFGRDKAAASLRSLVLLHLVEGFGDGVRARLQDVQSGRVQLDYQALPSSRFACQSSSQCCRSYRLGPVQPEEMAALLALPLRDKMPDLPDGDLFVHHESDGAKTIYLRTTGARCVFLRPNFHCGVHAHFGEALKPSTCRFYPLELQVTYEGARVYDKGHCASHFVSQTEGPAIIDSARLMRPRLDGTTTLFHPIVFLRDDTPTDFSQFLVLEGVLRETVTMGSPLGQLARTVAIYDSFVETVRGFALDEDPAIAIAAWQRALPQLTVEPTAPDWGLLIELFEQLAYELTDYLGDAHARHGENRDMAPLASQALPIVNYLYHRAVALSGREGAALDPAVEAAQPGAEDLVAALRRSLESHFYGRVAIPDDRPFLAIGQAALATLTAFVGAQRTAAAEGRPYGVADLSYGHMLTMRPLLTFATTQFKNNAERVRSLVRALPLLANWQAPGESGSLGS